MERPLVKHQLCVLLWNYVTLLVICSSCMQSVSSFTVKICDDIGTFQQMFGISLPMCAEECFRRQRCQMFMFQYGMNYCALKDDVNIQSLKKEEPVCTFYTRGDWSQVDLGPCNGHTCSDIEQCTNTTDDEFMCVKSECQTPEEIVDAKLLSNAHNIGATNRYRCKDGFRGHGIPTINCSENAEWSVTEFLCERKPGSCTTPQPPYNNAELTHGEGSQYTPGTILTFTCREGYRKSGSKWKSTCQTSLLWEPNGVRCCPDDTIIDGMNCYTIIEGGVVSSYTGANEFCRSIEGSFIWTTWNMRYMHNKTITRYALQHNRISSIPEKWNFTNCAAENGVLGDDSKSLQEKINDVVNNDWKGDSCSWGSMWSPGQPGSTEDDCIVRDLHDPNYKHHSFPCNFTGIENVGISCNFVIPEI